MPKDTLKIALNFLKFRPRSVFEVKQKLQSKNIALDEIDKTISVFKKNGLLDDAKFAKMWVSDRNLLKPRGTFLLKLELKNLGISQKDIEAALEEQDEEKLALQALNSKTQLKSFRLGSPEARRADFEKKAQFLQRRGFGLDIIYKILKKE